ncbi:hypothetical protein E5D57_003937 [Metarhizium anisopliae]|nr:hypothetical protein E5D57_003937 [Metarhizium anisopliae]
MRRGESRQDWCSSDSAAAEPGVLWAGEAEEPTIELESEEGCGGSLAASAAAARGVLHADLLAEHVLPVQVRDGGVAALKVAEADETEALAHAAVVPGHLGQAQQRAEAGEGVVEEFLVRHGVEVADEELGANVGALLLVGRRLVHAQRLAEQLDAVHDVGRVLGVRGRAELDEAEALVVLGDAVTRHVDVVDGAHLEHDFVDGCCRGALVNVAYVDCRFFVLFPGLRVS